MDAWVSLTFAIIFFQSLAGIAQDKYAYSLNQFYWLFNVVFFSIAPFIQYVSNVFPWVGSISEIEIITTNTYIILANLSYLAVRLFYKGKVKEKPESIIKSSLKSRWKIDYSSNYFRRTFFIFLVCAGVLILVTGFGNLFLRANSWGNASQYSINSSFRLVIDKFVRGGILFYVLLTILYFQLFRAKINMLWFAFILLIGIVTNFPTGIPRYMVGGFYFGVLINMKRQFKYNYLPILFAFLALCFIFPALGTTRSAEYDVNKSLVSAISPSASGYTGGNYDSYTMLSESFRYTDSFGITWGRQLSGSLFFFMPRTLWPDKPTGSGDTIAKAQNYVFANVGCPFLAEGVVNFGYLGGLGFIIILSVIVCRYDSFYWNMVKLKITNNFWVLMYPTTMGFLIFILRGDLLSSLSYFIGIAVGGISIFFLNKQKAKRRLLQKI